MCIRDSNTSYLDVSLDYLNFGVVSPDSSMNMEVLLSNTGEDDLWINDVNCNFPFTSMENNFMIHGNASYALDVGFTPISEGIYMDTLFINEEFAAVLYGESLDIIAYDSDIYIEQEVLDFNDVSVNSDSTAYVTVTNAGLGDLIFESLSTNSDQLEVLEPEHTHREA